MKVAMGKPQLTASGAPGVRGLMVAAAALLKCQKEENLTGSDYWTYSWSALGLLGMCFLSCLGTLLIFRGVKYLGPLWDRKEANLKVEKVARGMIVFKVATSPTATALADQVVTWVLGETTAMILMAPPSFCGEEGDRRDGGTESYSEKGIGGASATSGDDGVGRDTGNAHTEDSDAFLGNGGDGVDG